MNLLTSRSSASCATCATCGSMPAGGCGALVDADVGQAHADLQVLGLVEREVQHVGDRLRELVAGERRDTREARHALLDDGDVRDARTRCG